MDALAGAPCARWLGRMDPTDKNLHRLENFQAWQSARALAARAYRATLPPNFKEHPWLAEVIRSSALEVPCGLGRGHAMAGDSFERVFHYELAKSECARLQTLLAVADDLGLLSPADGTALYEGCEGTRRLVGGVLKAAAKGREDGPSGPKVRPSGFPGPSRRPPASGGGSRGGDPWDSRS